MNHWFSDVSAFRSDPLSFLVERGDCAVRALEPLDIGLRPTYLLTAPSYVKTLLTASEDSIDKGPLIKKFRAVAGNNVVISSGPQQKERRAMLHSIMARGAIERIAPLIVTEVHEAIRRIEPGKVFDARRFGASVALRVISVVAFGANFITDRDERVFIDTLDQMMTDLIDMAFRGMPTSPWKSIAQKRRIENNRRIMLEVVRRVRDCAPDSVTSRAMNELGLSERETADEILTLLLVGYDTAGAAAAWLLCHLAKVPELADQIEEEARAFHANSSAIDVREPSSRKVTTAAVKETLRLYPSSYWFGRGVVKDLEIGECKLRRGASIIVSPWLFHRSARFWESPDEFRLDRNHNVKAFLPFGHGPRSCVGAGLAMLELEIIAMEIASACRLTSAGPVGGPIPRVHLVPPPIPLIAELR
jgi:cytochrome P450